MNWIRDMFSWEIAALAAMVVLGAAALILIRRIWRGGLGSFEQSTYKMQKRINDTDAEIRERNLAISVNEQLYILEAALRELLELEESPAGCAVQRMGKALRLTTPAGDVDISYAVRQATLRSAGRVMRGAARWEVRHGEESHGFSELAQLMCHVRGIVSPQKIFVQPCGDIPSFSHGHAPLAAARRSPRRRVRWE